MSLPDIVTPKKKGHIYVLIIHPASAKLISVHLQRNNLRQTALKDCVEDAHAQSHNSMDVHL